MSRAIDYKTLTSALGSYETAEHWPAARSVSLSEGVVRPVCKCGWESKRTMRGDGAIERAIRYAFEWHIDILEEAKA